jgi:hypothetical protein
MTPEQQHILHDRVAEAGNFAQTATTNAVTALTSVTIAIVGAAVTISTTDYHASILENGWLWLISGAGSAAFAVLIALAIEALRSMRHVAKLHRIFVACDKEGFKTNWNDLQPDLKIAHLSVGIYWKILLPVVLFSSGLVICCVSFLLKIIKIT